MGDGGVADGEALLKFAEAMVSGAGEDLIDAREALIAAMGEAAMVDAAGVVSNFERMVRIADSTGITLGGGLETFSSEIRAELDLERFNQGKS